MNPDEIKAMRLELDLTQNELAALIGKIIGHVPARVTVAKWESGENRPCGKFRRALKNVTKYVNENPESLIRI